MRQFRSSLIGAFTLFSLGSFSVVVVGCKTRNFQKQMYSENLEKIESKATKEDSIREELAENKLPECSQYGITITPSVAYQTPNGAAKEWSLSNSLVATYQHANGLLPQNFFAIKILILEHLLRDPFLNTRLINQADVTEAQVKRIAKVMTSLHKVFGVNFSSASFPVPKTQEVPDERVKRLIMGAVKQALSDGQPALVKFASSESAREDGKQGVYALPPLSLSFEEALHTEENGGLNHSRRCVFTKTLGAMIEGFNTKEFKQVNATWKAKVSSGEVFDRYEFFLTEVKQGLKPVFLKSLESAEEKEAFELIWENLSY